MELMADTVVCITEQDARQYARARNKRVIPNFINTPRHTAKDYGAKGRWRQADLSIQKASTSL